MDEAQDKTTEPHTPSRLPIRSGMLARVPAGVSAVTTRRWCIELPDGPQLGPDAEGRFPVAGFRQNQPIEFGAESFGPEGEARSYRWWGVVRAVYALELVVERCDTIADALRRARELS